MAASFFAIRWLPLQNHFIGGGTENYVQNPMFWLWANFDGVHYMNIAQNGFGYGEFTFFPVYPILIKFLSGFFGNSLAMFNLFGQIISNLSTVVALFGLYKLIRIDFNQKIAKLSVILALLFPTAFYFVGVYTESLFFALLVWSFYFFRKGKYVQASILAFLLTLTRAVGIGIFPAFVIGWLWENFRSKNWPKKFPYIFLIIPLGLLSYMFYLYVKVQDPLAFFHMQVYVGEHRSSHIILIPQVLYRYIFKITPNLNYSYWQGVFAFLLEWVIGVLYLALSVYFFFKSKLSYAIFSFVAYITPTFLGSFSSLPRYVLILFPAYALLAKWLIGSRVKTFAFCSVLFILLIVSFCLFSRGFWLS